jgi:CBS domain containing-hemolysin-like protein
MASLFAALQALPSLQRRRLLEEGAIRDPKLAELMESPHVLGMGLTLWNQALLALVVVTGWSYRNLLPGGGWTLTLLVLITLWALDLVLPPLLTGKDPVGWLNRLFPFYSPLHYLLAPVIRPVALRFAQRREAARADETEDEVNSEEAVTALLEEGEAEGILEETDRELIRNVVTFGDTVVREVMTPRNQLKALPVEASLEEAWALFRETLHARLPVYEGNVDHVVGILLLKDLLREEPGASRPLRELLKPPLFVPESKPVPEVLRELQRARMQMAMVADEFGGVAGLVTMEDLLEEVVGEIQDEHEAGPDIQEISPGTYLVAGQIHIEDLAQRLELSWERNGFDTVAGLIMARLGHVPRQQESVAVEGATIKVLRMEGPRILQVRVQKLDPVPET